MINKIVSMKLLSDLCPGSGDGFAGVVDTDVCFDNLGLPYIPAKRIKGCLRECGLDILSVNDSYTPEFKELFGEAGGFASGTLNISSGKLENYDEITKSADTAERSELAEIFTSIRSRTKMDNGKAAQGTLRTVRVLNKGLVYEFPVSMSEETHDFFELCVKSLRSIGLNRSRGLGEVECSLNDGRKSSGLEFNVTETGDEYSFTYALKLLEPIISAERTGIPQGTESYIFGSAVLGVFASKYIEAKQLNREDAYKDPEFSRIFLNSGVKFTALMPEVDGQIYHPTPAVLRTDKLKKRLFDESFDVYNDNVDEDSSQPICKRLGGFYLTEQDATVKTYNPVKTSFLHHSRPADRSVAHATEESGDLYTYEAIETGQTFAGSIIGGKEDIHALAGLFSDSDTVRIGRSRTAQYGKATLTKSGNLFIRNSLNLKTEDTFRLVAVTPVILENENGINQTDVNLICDILGADYKIIRSVCSETTVSGYYSKWLLPRRQERALAEGSTVVLKYSGSGTTLNIDFIGKRTGEGFGQIRVEAIPEATAFSFPKDTDAAKTEAEKNEIAHERSRSTIPDVKKLRANKSAISRGIEYAEKNFVITGEDDNAPKGSNLSRIISILKLAPTSTKYKESLLEKKPPQVRQTTHYEEFSFLLGEIKQFEQKITALAFVTGKPKQYFKSDAKRLEIENIVGLLNEIGYEYTIYQKYLNAAAQRIKEKRRSIQKGKAG